MADETPIQKVHSTRYFNTLHGFEYGRGMFVVALTPENLNEPECTKRLRESTGVAVGFDDFIGHHYLAVPEADRDRIPDVIHAMLGLLETRVLDAPPPILGYLCTFVAGFDVMRFVPNRVYQTHTVSKDGHVSNTEQGMELDPGFRPAITLQTRLKPRYYAGDTFSLATSEYKMLVDRKYALPGWWHACTTLWKTVEGKQWAAKLAALEEWETNEFVVSNGNEFDKDGWYTQRLVESGMIENSLFDYPLANRHIE